MATAITGLLLEDYDGATFPADAEGEAVDLEGILQRVTISVASEDVIFATANLEGSVDGETWFRLGDVTGTAGVASFSSPEHLFTKLRIRVGSWEPSEVEEPAADPKLTVTFVALVEPFPVPEEVG